MLTTFFTFQSGYIQINSLKSIYDKIENFTFQSGYIQMAAKKTSHSGGTLFTFQSGYIQMGIGIHSCIASTYLYIPIWLYSNPAVSFNYSSVSTFTFQSGYIQIY